MSGVSKVVYAGRTLVDLTADTVAAPTLGEGVTAHAADGSAIVGAGRVMAPEDVDAALSDVEAEGGSADALADALAALAGRWVWSSEVAHGPDGAGEATGETLSLASSAIDGETVALG